jgi:hypothetical protein
MSIFEDIERVVAGEKLRQERRDRRRKKVDTFMDWAREIFGEKVPLFIPSVVDTAKHTRQPMVKWKQADRSSLLTTNKSPTNTAFTRSQFSKKSSNGASPLTDSESAGSSTVSRWRRTSRRNLTKLETVSN